MGEGKDLMGNLTSELRRGTLILSVLSQLSEERYGYSLVQSLEEKGVQIDPNTLYPLLRRLEKQGLLDSQWNVEEAKPQIWNLDMLLPIPDKKVRISRSDCIASIVFIVLFSCLLIFIPELFGASAMKEGGRVNIPVFNLEKWNVILPFFIIGLTASFVNELIRLVTGRYCKTVMWSTIITNGIQFISAVIILKVLPLWNHGFAEGIAALDSDFKMKTYWQNEMVLGVTGDVLSNIVLGVIAFAMILEVGVAVYKTMRYSREVSLRKVS